MRKFLLTVLFCLGLFLIISQRPFSQEAAEPVDIENLGDKPEFPRQLDGLPAFPQQVPALPPSVGMPPMMGADPRAASGMRSKLTAELREIHSILGQVDPRDTSFIETLRERQAAIIEQLKSLEAPQVAPNTRSVGTPLLPPGQQPIQQPMDRFPFQRPPFSEPPMMDHPLPSNWEQLPVEDIAKIFAAQQQANPRSMPLPPQLGTQHFQPTPYGEGRPTFGSPREAFSVPPMPQQNVSSPWGTAQPSQEIIELKEKISTLQSQIEQMRDEIKALNSQMQLLNQNILLKLK